MVRNKYFFLLLIGAFSLLSSCISESGDHLIKDARYRKSVEEQFNKRKELFLGKDSALFQIFNHQLTTKQREALQYLYAYMPLNDLADYSGNFFLEQVNTVLKAKKTFDWGKNVPDDIFLHFVLPYRVNNENLDNARTVFFEELKDHVAGLSDVEAALEVNHWCHEKVSYRGSDSRTSSPLATLKTAFGRCGEESTFTVAALRAVGIPARQVYTPRWAHQDDNHAWVEVYVGGKWQYMGACEPEPLLNVGWFDVPAKRAMLVHTKAFGLYNGTEETVVNTDLYSELNIIASYADSKRIYVSVKDENMQPLPGAKVEYKLYNYARFYPIATQYSDKDGMSQLLTGLGDLCVWVSHNDKYNYKIISVGDTDTLTLVPDRVAGEAYTEIYDLRVPGEHSVALPPADLIKKNGVRLAHEDSLRAAYMSTFMKEDDAVKLAQQWNLAQDKIVKIMQLSYGNYQEIRQFLELYHSHPCALPLLESISEKDIRDTRADILADHLNFTRPTAKYSQEVFNEGILSPRISNEELRSWRKDLQVQFQPQFKEAAQKDINVLVDWVRNSIRIDSVSNYYNCPLTPLGVNRLRVADVHSRNIYFVALCRLFHIPARIDAITAIPQYYNGDRWQDVSFRIEKIQNYEPAALTLVNDPENEQVPQYETHFTLQKFENGVFRPLEYTAGHFNMYPVTVELSPGYYCLMTGHRYNDGNVRSKQVYFNMKPDEKLSLSVTLLPLEERKQVLGQIDMNTQISTMGGQAVALSEMAEKGVVLAIIDPANEPTRHILADIQQAKAQFDNWGGKVVFMIPDDKITEAFTPSAYTGLPEQSVFAKDNGRLLLKQILKTCGKSDEILPSVFFITQQGEVIFLSQGYRIGISGNLLKTTKFNN